MLLHFISPQLLPIFFLLRGHVGLTVHNLAQKKNTTCSMPKFGWFVKKNSNFSGNFLVPFHHPPSKKKMAKKQLTPQQQETNSPHNSPPHNNNGEKNNSPANGAQRKTSCSCTLMICTSSSLASPLIHSSALHSILDTELHGGDHRF